MLNVINLTDPTIHNDIALNAIHYTLGLVASAQRAKFHIDKSDLPINYFGLTLAGSGEGKDRSVEIAKKILAPVIEMYQLALEHHFAKFNAALGPKDKPIPMPMFEFERATIEGFLSPRVDIQTVGFGCTNLRIPEIQDMLSSKDSLEIFSEVVKAWESGDTGGKTNRGAPIAPTVGIPVNVLVYGSPNAIKTNKQLSEQLLKMLTSGLGRRAFLAVPAKHEVHSLLRALEEPTPAIIAKMHADIHDASLISSAVSSAVMETVKAYRKQVFTLTVDAELLYRNYNYRCKTAFLDRIDVSDGLVAEMLGRGWKAVRLAALYAFYDGFEYTITEQNMKDSIEYTERCGQNVEDLYHVPSNAELILSYLAIQKDPQTRQSIMKNALDTSMVVAFTDSMSLADELADERNQVIERSEDKVVKYSLKQLSAIDLDSITISISTSMHENWKPLTGKFSDLASFLKSGSWYSAGTFKDGKRNNDSYLQSQDLIIFDVDDGMDLDTAKSFFSDFRCIIATTKSHQVEKHPGTGDICDRYRIILVPDCKIEMDPETYSQFMLNAMDFAGIPADRKAIDPARFFFGNKEAEVWVSEGEKLFPVKACMPSTAKSEIVSKRLEKYDSVEGIERYFIASTDKGDRNNKLWRYACVLKDDNKYSDDEIESMIIALNEKIADPLPERELRSTILKSIKRKT